MASAAMDRLVYHAVKIVIEGKSYRLNNFVETIKVLTLGKGMQHTFDADRWATKNDDPESLKATDDSWRIYFPYGINTMAQLFKAFGGGNL